MISSRRNVFSRGGGFMSPRSDLRKQASLRNAFKNQKGSLKNMQGSLRNVFSRSPKGGKRGSTDTGRAVAALGNSLDRRASTDTGRAVVLPSVEEHNAELRKLRANNGDTTKGKAEKQKRTKKVKKEKSSSSKDKSKPPKKTKSSSSADKKKKKKTKKETDKTAKTKKVKISLQPAQQFPPLSPGSSRMSPKSFAKHGVKVDMAGQLNLDLTAHSLTEHTHTEATHDMWLCPSPGVSPAVSLRKIHQAAAERSPSGPIEAKIVGTFPAACNSPAAATRVSHATSASNRTSDDDISILSEEDYSEQIMEDLSCVLDCDEENDFVSQGDDAYWDEEEEEEEEILEDEELCDEEDDDEGARSYVDLYCSPRDMKRISDLTGATGAFTMNSVMYDDDDNNNNNNNVASSPYNSNPRYPTVYVSPSSRSDADLRGKRRSSVNSTTNRRASMSRISELTEVTMYELENFDYEDDENYDCSSIVSSDSSSFVVPNRKPMSFYSTSGKQSEEVDVDDGPEGQHHQPEQPPDRSGVVSDDNGDSSTLSSSFGKYRKPISFYSTSEKQDNPFVVSPTDSNDEPPKSPTRLSRKIFDGGNLPPRYPEE